LTLLKVKIFFLAVHCSALFCKTNVLEVPKNWITMTIPQAQSAVQASLDQATKDPKNGIHGIAFVAVDKNGDVLAQHASGTRSQSNGNDPVTMETMFYIASCTKFIVTIACMQLVEQGKIGLDDAQALYKICPELEKVQVFDVEKGELRPRKGDITLRKLLAHTAGFGYGFFDVRLKLYGQKIGRDFNEFSGDIKDIIDQPLFNDPDTVWEYGINIDWAGIVVERISGLTLGEYCKKNIFEPLGLKNITFFPTAEQKQNIMTMLQRGMSSLAGNIALVPTLFG
jgi:CubicO group peptidase (beta-lactamase class C family)